MIVGSTSVTTDCSILLEATEHRQDALDLSMQYGTPIQIRLRKESDVSRDKLNSIKQKDITNDISTYALPVERQPDRKKLEKAGIREDVDVIVYTPILAWIKLGYIKDATIGKDFTAIDIIRSTIILDGSEWKIADKGLSTRIGQYPLYITFGLKKN